MKRLARSAGRRASGVLAWSATLQAAEGMATLCSRSCQLHSVVISDCSAAAGNTVYPRCPFDLDVGDGLLGGGMQVVQAVGPAAYFVEIWLCHVVKMRRRAGPDISDHRNLGRRWRLVCPRGERLAAGQQPFRRNPEAPRIFFGVLRAIVAAAGTLRALMGAVGRHRNAHRLARKARRLEALLARDS